MEIGVYQLKYPFRKLIGFLMPFFRDVHPNQVSLSLIPLGFVTALLYAGGPTYPSFYLLGFLAIFARMVVGTMDGLLAVTYGLGSPKGEMLNRIAPEACDIMLMLAIVSAQPELWILGCLALAVSWGITFAGLIGIVASKPIQSVGPVGQTDRVVALGILSVLQYFSLTGDWGTDFIKVFLVWVIVGGTVTIALRLKRHLNNDMLSKEG